MVKSRTIREGANPTSDQLAIRGLPSGGDVDAADVRRSAALNCELYGFHGISVWVPNADYPVEWLQRTKLAKFDRYAEYLVGDLKAYGMGLRATGQSPHYDVVSETDDLDDLVRQFMSTPHRVGFNPRADRDDV